MSSLCKKVGVYKFLVQNIEEASHEEHWSRHAIGRRAAFCSVCDAVVAEAMEGVNDWEMQQTIRWCRGVSGCRRNGC